MLVCLVENQTEEEKEAKKKLFLANLEKFLTEKFERKQMLCGFCLPSLRVFTGIFEFCI